MAFKTSKMVVFKKLFIVFAISLTVLKRFHETNLVYIIFQVSKNKSNYSSVPGNVSMLYAAENSIAEEDEEDDYIEAQVSCNIIHATSTYLCK